MNLTSAYPDLAGLYDRLAPCYDQLHRRWLTHAGGEAQAALEAAVRIWVSPEARVLDAGCGTGAFARRLLGEGVMTPDQLTLMDPSSAMLGRCADIPCDRVRGRLEAMPFKDGVFDIVTCAWALETSARPDTAVKEIHRVLRPGGVLCLAFCADQPARGVLQRAICQMLRLRATGRFLPLHDVCAAITATQSARVLSVPVAGPVAMLIAKRDG